MPECLAPCKLSKHLQRRIPNCSSGNPSTWDFLCFLSSVLGNLIIRTVIDTDDSSSERAVRLPQCILSCQVQTRRVNFKRLFNLQLSMGPCTSLNSRDEELEPNSRGKITHCKA